MTFYIIAAVACIVLSAFFSGAEMALSAANRIRLENLADDGNRSAALAVKVLDRFDDALGAILIGNNFVNIALSSLGSVIAIVAFGERYAWLSTVIVTVAVIIFGETVPKIVAKKNANRMSLAVAPAVRALTVILKPLTLLAVSLIRLITGPLRGEADGEEPDAAVEELQSIIETTEDEDVLDEDRSELLQAALDFDEISVSEVMTARVDIVAVDIEDSWEEIYAVACAPTCSNSSARRSSTSPSSPTNTAASAASSRWRTCWNRSSARSGTRPTRSRRRSSSAPTASGSWTATCRSATSPSCWA